MANLVKKMTPAEIQALYRRLQPLALKETKPQYTRWCLKTSDCTITAYESGKVMFQGKDLSWLEDEPSKPSVKPASASDISSGSQSLLNGSSTFPQAGSDEVGTGDYFGPIVVCAALVEDRKTAQKLRQLGVTDSKKMTDAWIEKIGPEVMKLVPHSVQILDNETYNRTWNRSFNHIKIMLAVLHNAAWNELAEKNTLPEASVIDQFCPAKTYFGYLEGRTDIFRNLRFQTRAESSWMAVAAASVIARYTFLRCMKKLDQKWNVHFAKGAGLPADQSIRSFLARHPFQDLEQVAKLDFANTEKTALKTVPLDL